MREEFLHFIWRYKKIDVLNLYTTENQKIDILDFGQYNTDAGADFLNAKIKIEETEWVGHIEMHVLSSEWTKHRHQNDPQYENVILHVVYTDDTPIRYPNSEERIPCLVLENNIDMALYDRYEALLIQESWIPCEPYLRDDDKRRASLSYYSLTIERISRKSEDLARFLKHNNNDWGQTVFTAIARGFGLRINTDGFEQLCHSLPINILRKHTDQRSQIEALLYGQAGLLTSKFRDTYPTSLYKEYNFLRHKYDLTPISPVYWKFLRLRPANFPTIRISQFANLIMKHSSLFSLIMEAPVETIKAAFLEISASLYWDDHYRFDKSANKESKKNLGQKMIDLILINSIAPVLFMYGKNKKSQSHIDKAIQLLEMVNAENNNITRKWKELGFDCQSAFDSQALLQLKKEYCVHNRCLHCTVGYNLLSK